MSKVFEFTTKDYTWACAEFSSLGSGDDYNVIHLGLFGLGLFIHTPVLIKDDGGESRGFGFHFSDEAFVVSFGRWRKYFHYPWSLNYHGIYVRVVVDGEERWIKTEDRTDPLMRKWFMHDSIATKETHDYTYFLKDGTIQNRKATIYGEIREWRRRWLPWTRLFSLQRRSIDVRFDGEVGERTGRSWKGGTVGCGWDFKPGEQPVDALRRMEKERVFR